MIVTEIIHASISLTVRTIINTFTVYTAQQQIRELYAVILSTNVYLC